MNSALPRNPIAALLHPWTWRMAWRDSRSQRARLVIFSLAIVAGVAALVSIHSLKESVQQGINTQAKSLLGSDLMVSSREPIRDEDAAKLNRYATRSSRETSLSSMMFFPSTNGARLVQVRAIDGAFPFYGKVKTEPAGAWQKIQQEKGVLLEPALLDQFRVKVGDTVKLGSAELPILGVVTDPAPQSSRFSGFAPEVYLGRNQLEATGLMGVASMSTHLMQLKLPAGTDAVALKKKLQEDFADAPWRLETPEDRQQNLGDALDNFQRFLAIIALAALVLGAIGVAGAVHAHINKRVPVIAILRCLGCPGNVAFGIYLIQAAVLGLIGALLGAAVGIGLQVSVLTFFAGDLPFEIPIAPQWGVVLQTTAAGFGVCCGFALIPLLKIRRISPAATLRGGAMLAGRNWLAATPVYLLLAGLLVLLSIPGDSNWKRALAMVAGLAGAFLVLLLVAKCLTWLSRKLVRPSWPYLLRQGISNLHRPHNQTVLFLLSLGLGTFLLVTILLTGNLLKGKLSVSQLAESPNLYLIDVQPDQEPGVREVVKNQGLPVLESAPMVTMRIASIRGIPVQDLLKEKKVPRWLARREFRSTFRTELNSTETLMDGEWKTQRDGADAPAPVSLEEGIAKDLGVKVGDSITMDVQGVPIETQVTSIRQVDWSKFNLNFFMVFTPDVLADAPGFHVVTTKAPDAAASGNLQRELVRGFPNVTAIDLAVVLETIRKIVDGISQVISVLAGFTLLAAIPILTGTFLNGRDLRVRESVLLRTLGASARQVRIILLIEYAALGFLSAVTGLALAVGANAVLATRVFKASPWPDFWILAAAFAVTTGLSILGGILLGRGVNKTSPLEILRSGV
ncbi:ABC transporter permease [Luteolibacter pohnpeiensis]|uniref:ABC transporter permease n=1 Tax=Luteolibacter pohnpeiensis TaxID=454153 RepID=A0A934SC72_9BACT|nr:FtsX-like permease family protein [Luteolibacter pohnpeiensis]MBK1883224.1 ABC transporter permease [Luteolibacter pohnpeiensis]